MRITGQEHIAALLGVSARTITEWQAAGMPVAVQGGPGTPGEYDAPACVRWLVEREVRKVQGESPKDRLARLQGDQLEMDLAERRGKLIEAGAVEPMMRAAIVSARERIRNEPARIAATLEGKDKAEREAMLRELFDEVLMKLSRWQQPGVDEDGDEDACERDV
jgi:phage terminase Nu1 subunit (DNA packaging protein)